MNTNQENRAIEFSLLQAKKLTNWKEYCRTLDYWLERQLKAERRLHEFSLDR